MSILLHIYPGDAWALLIANVLVQVTVVILTAWLLARLGSRWNAAWRHSIYLVALLCVLASPALSWVMQASGIALVTLRPSAPTASPAESVRISMTHIPESNFAETPATSEFTANRMHTEAESLRQGLPPGNPPALSFPDILRALGGVALVIWLLGMALLLARWCHGLHLIAALRRAAQPLDSEAMAELLRQVRQALGVERLPPMATSTDLDRPIMVGLIRPLVILPENVLWTLHEPELADILVHECAHAVRRHQVVGLLQRAAGMLFWPHPLVHLLNRELARAREEVCDNYVLRRSDAPRYARTLLELSQLLVGVSPKSTALGLFHCPWKLEDRVADLLDRRRRAMIRVSRLTAAALTATFLLIALLIAGTSILQAAQIERRTVNKLIRDFPEKTDLSTPESAMAACARNIARNDIRAALDLSWVKMDAKIVKDIEDAFKHDPNAPKDLGTLYLDAEIIEVLTYHDDFAVVICKSSIPGAGPYGGEPFGKINGVWKSLGIGFSLGDSPKDWSSQSDKAVIEHVEQKKDEFWGKFVGIRNEVLNGRTPMFDAKGRVASADSTKSEKTTDNKTATPPAKDSKSQPPLLSAAEKEEKERELRKTWRLGIILDVPKLSPQAVQYAILDHNPVPAFASQLNSMQSFYRRQLEQADNEARKDMLRDGQMSVSWNMGFREITADKLYLLTNLPTPDLKTPGMVSNSPEGKKWIVTKTVSLEGKSICWCVPVEVKIGEQIEITLSEKNTFDMRTAYDNAMRGPVSASNQKTWQIALDLDVPSLSSQAVQYTVFDEDPVPAFIAQVKRTRSYAREQLEKARTEVDKEQINAVQMEVGWDLGFKKVTGDKLYLLKNADNAGMMSNAPAGKKWIVTKIVHVQGKPVCWCIPVEVKLGEQIEVSFNEKNTFDLRTVYDNAMREPVGIGGKE